MQRRLALSLICTLLVVGFAQPISAAPGQGSFQYEQRRLLIEAREIAVGLDQNHSALRERLELENLGAVEMLQAILYTAQNVLTYVRPTEIMLIRMETMISMARERPADVTPIMMAVAAASGLVTDYVGAEYDTLASAAQVVMDGGDRAAVVEVLDQAHRSDVRLKFITKFNGMASMHNVMPLEADGDHRPEMPEPCPTDLCE